MVKYNLNNIGIVLKNEHWTDDPTHYRMYPDGIRCDGEVSIYANDNTLGF